MTLSHQTLHSSGVLHMGTLPKGQAKNVHTVGRKERSNTEMARFRHNDPQRPFLYGAWCGKLRSPTVLVEAPSHALTTFLREDPEGPFAGTVDDWPADTLDQNSAACSRWQRWGFEIDAREAILKADWHTLPHLGESARLFVPRMGKPGSIQKAPSRYIAFAEAFRVANKSCFDAIVEALKKLAAHALDQHGTVAARLVSSLIECIEGKGHFGVVEAQVWWGDEKLLLPSHKDGATSLLHLGVTLGGIRTLRVGTFMSPDEAPDNKWLVEDVWDSWGWSQNGMLAAGLKDVRMTRGSCYLSSPWCFEHGVRYEVGSRKEPVIALQCRFAFKPDLGNQVNRNRDDLMLDISTLIATTLRDYSERGKLRMPTVQEVQVALVDVKKAQGAASR
eukprot:gnl/TRDRNA2_/TRDRNA2_135774_c1_seq1.p1 gnl/TRDRNA2_/TRDRNA2_135774_c1~~gnl/TRDRNA2_/TRDRNA2_135774_c1_seq1.p1  ORF type:complete len:454 (+),score=62.33 gnl/TRDRNA2_/TRDRNA2_135774_c1_seq1:194-1363(+)